MLTVLGTETLGHVADILRAPLPMQRTDYTPQSRLRSPDRKAPEETSLEGWLLCHTTGSGERTCALTAPCWQRPEARQNSNHSVKSL